MRITDSRVDILGVGVSVVDLDGAVDAISGWIESDNQTYVCVTGVHGIMESQRDAELKEIHNRSGLTTPDGMPMVWAGRWAGVSGMSRVYGPDLMIKVLEHAAERGWTSFFYGGGPGVAELLTARLSDRIPGLKAVGTLTPPFRTLTVEEDAGEVEIINSARPDLLWIGVSTPKQERWMASHLGKVDARVMMGVGAAFDIHAGLKRSAPARLQQLGLEWAYRLVKEPRRLWRRYFRIIPAFIARVMFERPKVRSWPVAPSSRTEDGI